MNTVTYIDLFCGIGGFHHAMVGAANELGLIPTCVFASDIDQDSQRSYLENFGITPHGDITAIPPKSIPGHDILFAGFPCQAFSIIGDRKGFQDTRGTLFFTIAEILKAKKPKGFVLENVKQLRGHDKGRTLEVILGICKELGYSVDFRVLNALDFGLPQKRERIFIVGWKGALEFDFDFASCKFPSKSLGDILEKRPGNQYYASSYIQKKRQKKFKSTQIAHGRPTIWHENKAGNISAYEYSCALRAGASYNYLLVDGKRRMTEREMLRLQGFPDDHKIVGTYSVLRKQTGNSLPVPMARAVITRLLDLNLVGGKHASTKNSAGIGDKVALPA